MKKCDYCRQPIEKKLNYHKKLWRYSDDLFIYKKVFIHNWCLELAQSENPSKYRFKRFEEEKQEIVEIKKQEWL